MTPIWKERIDKLTYGLVYPAFFGNMIYDLFLVGNNFKNKEFLWVDFITAILIVIYFIVDYIHLYADMNKLVEDCSKKSTAYLLCDIGASFFFFISFIGIKENIHWVSLIFLPLIPLLIYSYKKHNSENKKNNIFFLRFFRLSFVFAIAIGGTMLLIKSRMPFDESYLILGFVFLSMIVHFYYVFWFYPKFGKDKDDLFMKTTIEY